MGNNQDKRKPIPPKMNQAKLLQESREQLKMIKEWQELLMDIEGKELKRLNEYWFSISGYELTEYGFNKLRKLLKQYNFQEIIVGMKKAIEYYGDKNIDKAFDKIKGVCYIQRQDKKYPGFAKLYYIRGIIKHKYGCDYYKIMPYLKQALKKGYDADDLQDLAISSSNYEDWENKILRLLED